VPPVSFFNKFGLLGVPGFLDAETCARLRREIAGATTVSVTVGEAGGTFGVDESYRKTRRAKVSSAASSRVTEGLLALRQDVSQTFGADVSGVQDPQFLVYRKGDFFRLHRDRDPAEDAARFSGQRQVSAVLFLNGESGDPVPGTHTGGALTLYGLIDDGRGGMVGLPVTAETGSLIAFPSDMVHEVKPVTRGERYSVVSWFY
jgi:SM-20-related protein